MFIENILVHVGINVTHIFQVGRGAEPFRFSPSRGVQSPVVEGAWGQRSCLRVSVKPNWHSGLDESYVVAEGAPARVSVTFQEFELKHLLL